MKKTIIALQGKPNSGKTHTLKMLIWELAKTYSDAEIKCMYRYAHVVKIKNVDLNEYMSSGVDKVVMFTLSNGLKIGIITFGDPGNDVIKDYLNGFVYTFPCDIIFCGCRFDNETVGEIEYYRIKGINIHYIEQKEKTNDEREISNDLIVKELRNLANI